MKLRFSVLVLLVFFVLSCNGSGGESSLPREAAAQSVQTAAVPVVSRAPAPALAPSGTAVLPANGDSADSPEIEFPLFLETVAELERAGSFFPGLGLIESGEREKAGDFAGAVFAVYKDLSYAYGYNKIPRAEVEEGIANLLSMKDDSGNTALVQAVRSASRAVNAFFGASWSEAATLLAKEKPYLDEQDSFYQWMMLVAALEGGSADHTVRSAYGAIRGRYTNFPEYWYRGARTFADDRAIVYAEQCINMNPENPFVSECRQIIAASIGLDSGGENLRSKAEIEQCIRQSVSDENPEILSALFPLMELPDNSYTLYALGALKSLASVPMFNIFFREQAALCSGRLAERLSYLTRG